LFCTFHYYGRGGTPSLASHDGTLLIFIIQNFEQLALALKKQSYPENFLCIEIFLSFRIFELLALALKTEFALKLFTVLK